MLEEKAALEESDAAVETASNAETETAGEAAEFAAGAGNATADTGVPGQDPASGADIAPQEPSNEPPGAASFSSTLDGDDDFDIDFDDPDLDLGPSLAEQLAAISVPDDDAADAAAISPNDEEAQPADEERNWFVIHCYSGYENKVRHNLEQRIETMGMQDQIFDVVVPTEEEIEVKEGKRRTVERRVFPGYILVQLQLSEESWYVVRNTPGVTGFVGMGNTPTPLNEQEVKQIMLRMEAEAPTIKVSFRQGQKVRIIDGPFNDFIGAVDVIDMERGKVRVMVSFFGRETPVELDFLQVEKI